MRTAAERLALALPLVALLTGEGACGGDFCNPGQQRACTNTLAGGYTQSGYQACSSGGAWSQCVSVGVCRAPGGMALPVYNRCGVSAQCGPAQCAECGHYVGVQNPRGYGVCYVFCQTDDECAPTTAATGVTPRCVLGQCTLLCRDGARCPNDTACLPWTNASLATTYPGYIGLCE